MSRSSSINFADRHRQGHIRRIAIVPVFKQRVQPRADKGQLNLRIVLYVDAGGEQLLQPGKDRGLDDCLGVWMGRCNAVVEPACGKAVAHLAVVKWADPDAADVRQLRVRTLAGQPLLHGLAVILSILHDEVSIESPDGFPEDRLYRTGGTEPPATTWDKQAKTLTVRELRLTRLKAVKGPFKRGLHSVLTLAKSIFPVLNTDPIAFERAWETALRVVDWLSFEKFGTTDHFAEDVPGYRAIASQLWTNTPASAVGDFYARLQGAHSGSSNSNSTDEST